MSQGQEGRQFYRVWGLPDCRDTRQEEPAPHQAKALASLDAWFEKRGRNGRAGILVLPTGGGKTFTAVRFLAQGPISEGYKVLWLAHTHHLLEQAFECFRPARIGTIREPRRELRLRVVSGTPGHFPPRMIEPTDDVVIGTLQTIATAINEGLEAMGQFLDAAGKKLIVIFDEAHHAPAPSYRKLVQGLQARSALVLGLTATPVYSDDTKQGRLRELFPDGIVAQSRATELMAAGILARPHAVPIKTAFAPRFEARDYEKWVGTFKDIPEHLIDELARNAERNEFIAQTYVDNRKKFGKTIVFTDRWYQCEAIAESLKKRGVMAGAVYSHVDLSPLTVRERRKRDADENARVLERFRKGELDVLINVRMLTEGTDIPDAQTVFLTRQTTSTILLTQMVGRALRGPKFGGTADAYVVSFEDDWRQRIQWAGFTLYDGSVGVDPPRPPPRPPLYLVSIELVKRLARQMSGGINVASVPFLSHMPVGWYRTLFDARLPGEDDVEPVDLLVMVYEDEREGFERLVAHLLADPPEELADESVTMDSHEDLVSNWRKRFLGKASRSATDLGVETLQVARHIAQRGSAPQFFSFDVRAEHDLDAIAAEHVRERLDLVRAHEALRREFTREDRFWRTLFHRYEQFRHFYDSSVGRILMGSPVPEPTPTVQKKAPSSEPDQRVKDEVLDRDGRTCLVCGTTRSPEVDHIVSVYHGGSNEPGNLQTLCAQCNRLKAKRRMSFRDSRTALVEPPAALPELQAPASSDAANPDAWVRFLRRTINFFYRCAAVGQVGIAGRGDGYYNWTVTLRSDNPPGWLKPHLPGLLERIHGVRDAGRKPRVVSLRIIAPEHRDLVVRDTP